MAYKYFMPNETFDRAIKDKEEGVLKALLIGILGSDPTFETEEYEEAKKYIEVKYTEEHGDEPDFFEDYCRQEGEYEKEERDWDENYYGMLLVWFRDNYSKDRLNKIKVVGTKVYKDKLTLGKAKRKNREQGRKSTSPITPEKKNRDKDSKIEKLDVFEWLKRYWWLIIFGLVIMFLCWFLFRE